MALKRYFLFVIMVSFLYSCAQKPEWIKKLSYTESEVFPITIDQYGGPNVKIELHNTRDWILWDTGNMVGLVLSDKMISKYNFPVQDSVRLRDSEGNLTGISYRYLIDSITILGRKLRNMIVAETTQNYNGLIGPESFSLNRFTIDYKHRLIAISGTKLPVNTLNGEKFNLVISKDLPELILIEGKVNGKTVLMELDTGKSRTVVDPGLVENLNLPQGKKGVLMNLSLGQFNFKIDNGKIKGFKGISRGLDQPIMIGIGSDLLKEFLFTVDYGNQVVLLNPIDK